MSNQSQFNSAPLQEGVEHGPYKESFDVPPHDPDAKASHQLQGHMQAIRRARQAGSITTAASEQLLGPIYSAQAKHRENRQRYQDDLEEWEESQNTEDPLAGDVEPTGGYYEGPEMVDVRDLEVNDGPDGEPVDGHGNRIYPD